MQGIGLGGDIDVLHVQLSQEVYALCDLPQHCVALLPVAVQRVQVRSGIGIIGPMVTQSNMSAVVHHPTERKQPKIGLVWVEEEIC